MAVRVRTASTHANGYHHVLGQVSAAGTSTESGPHIFDGIPYIYVSWDRMGEYTFELAKEVLASGEQFDSIVALAKGGWTWARTLSDHLQIDHVSSIRYRSYSNVNENPKLEMVQPLTESVSGQRVLIFDDVIDSGHTARQAKTYLRSMGAKRVKVAMLGYKPRSVVMPDFYAFETTAWIVFPHEVREFIELSSRQWTKNGASIDEILRRFALLRVPADQIEYFLALAEAHR